VEDDCLNVLKVPSGLTLKSPHIAHKVYLCTLFNSYIEQPLFSYTVWTDYFF